MPKNNSEITFKFRYVMNAHAQGIFAKKGIVNEQEILLDKERLIYDDIVDSTTRDRRIVLTLSSSASLSKKVSEKVIETAYLVLEIYNAKPLEIERFIDRISSKKEVEQKQRQLIAAGEGNLFRSAVCPHCEATIDLSDLNRSSYIYCRFCETVFRETQTAMTRGENYRVCEECQMFDRVKGYTEFYFYFLLVVYGYSYKRRHLCDNCAGNLFVKMILINFIFILGIIPSLCVKIKSMMGRDPELKRLAKANALALNGKYDRAAGIYEQLYQSYANHPGLLMNQGIGHLKGSDLSGASRCFEKSLAACSNYVPTMRLLQRMQAATQSESQ